MENWKAGRYLLKGYGRKCMVMSGYSILMAAGVYGFLALQIRIWDSYGMRYCMLDCMHALEQSWNFGMFYLVLTSALMVSDRKVYRYPAFVLQYENTQKIWGLMAGSLLRKSIGFSLIYSSIVCLFSGLASYTVSDWSVQDSMYFTANQTVYMGKTAYVFAAFFIFAVIKTFLGAVVLLLFDSRGLDMLWGYLLLACPIVLEWELLDTGLVIFFNLFSISYSNFVSLQKVLAVLAAGVLLIGGTYLLGKKIWKEKEFYGETQRGAK